MEHLHYAHHTVPADLLNQIFPCHHDMMSAKPQRAGCHVWRQACASAKQEVQELNPDVIAECYLDANCYHYDPVELANLVDVYANFANLANSDNILTVNEATMGQCECVYFQLMRTLRNWRQSISVQTPAYLSKKDAVSGLAAVKEMLIYIPLARLENRELLLRLGNVADHVVH